MTESALPPVLDELWERRADLSPADEDARKQVVAAVERDPVDLIETVAERVAAVALGFAAANAVRVTVHKPDAPIAVPFADVAVTIVRRRGSAGIRGESG